MDDADLKSFIGVINAFSATEEKSCRTWEELTAAFRHVRNICARGAEIQNEIFSDPNVLNSTHSILNDLMNSEFHSDASQLCLLVGLQFVANLLVNNYEIQSRVWERFNNVLTLALRFNKNPKVQNCAAMITYNIFLGHPELMSPGKDAFEDVIPLTTNENSFEFPLYLLQLFIKKTNSFLDVYDVLKPESKLTVIEAVQDLVRDNGVNLDADLVSFFVKKFLNYSDKILNILQSSDSQIEAHEVVKILELITSISSSDESGLHMLQSQKSLLISSIMLLKSVHAISKESDNEFSMIQKLSELDIIEKNSSVQDHPYFGFKCSLIRLIGNMCWNHVGNQDTVRELEGIPVLLDCCNIDGRNPFIIQWCTLAIRNICDKNVANQMYIAQMQKTGIIDVEKMQRMGIVLNKEKNGSTLAISPLEFKK